MKEDECCNETKENDGKRYIPAERELMHVHTHLSHHPRADDLLSPLLVVAGRWLEIAWAQFHVNKRAHLLWQAAIWRVGTVCLSVIHTPTETSARIRSTVSLYILGFWCNLSKLG